MRCCFVFWLRKHRADIQIFLDGCLCMFISAVNTDVFTLTVRQIRCHRFFLSLFLIPMAVGDDLFAASRRFSCCVKNSHSKSDTEPPWRVFSEMGSALRKKRLERPAVSPSTDGRTDGRARRERP